MILKYAVIVSACLMATYAQASETLRMAVTTSFHNSGLAEILLPEIAKDTQIEVQLLVVGTGQALKLGRAGDVDAILVHSRAAEDAFVAEGFGTRRTEIMFNDFVVIGPATDPADIASADSAADSLRKIATQQTRFVSRGDDSGTHKKELSLWAIADTMPDGPWYNAVGAGMGAALNTAVGLDAYVLSDRASWLNFGNKAGHIVLFEGDPVLFNQYSFLPVSPDKHPHVKADAVNRLEAWLTSDAAKALINEYTIDGQTLFVFNANQAD